jgi:acetyltransferase-like isoleucine patch superfamily enzyme
MKVVIIGAGSVAHMVADIVRSDHNFILEGFVGTPEEERKYKEKELFGLGRFLGDHTVLPHLQKEGVYGFVVAVGDNYLREKYYYECQQYNLCPVNVISSDVIIQHNVSLGKGVIICPGAILCSGVTIGNNIIIEPGVICNVNSKVCDHSNIRVGAIIRGMVEIGKNVHIGIRSYAGEDIGKNNKISIGEIVTKKIEDKFRAE